MIAFLSIDKVIKVIRNSDEPKQDLMAKFSLSEIQAEDILEIRLRQLARLEGIRIEKELAELKEERSALQKLLDERKEMTRLILKEIEQDAKQYGDGRRTLIEAVAPVAPAEIQVPDEPVTVILSKNGWVRRRDGHGHDRTASPTRPATIPSSSPRRAPPRRCRRRLQRPRLFAARLRPARRARRRRADRHHDRLVAGSNGYGFVAGVADMMFPLAELKEMAKGKGLMLIDLAKNDEGRRRHRHRWTNPADRRQRARRQARRAAAR
jgi:hypothetical protein